MPKPSPEKREPRMGEQLNHTCYACQEYIPTDELSIWRQTDEKVWFMHIRHNPEVNDE